MTRVCYALTLLLFALGGSLLVTSPAQCQTITDEYRFGSRYYHYYETCPVVDGYIQTHGEDYSWNSVEDATSVPATNDSDLRSRSVVAVLDDPAVDATQELQAALPDDSANVNVNCPAENVADDVQPIEAPSTVTSSDNQPEIRYHGCYEEYVNPCQPTSVVGNETECPEAVATDSVSSDIVPQYSKPYDTYDYGYRYGGSDMGGCPSIHNYGYRYGGSDTGICPSVNTEAVPEVVTKAVVDVLPEVVARDCEDECYQAYLQRCADEAAAAAQLVAEEAAAPASDCEPYDAYGYEYRAHSSFMVDRGEPVIAESAIADEAAEQVSESETVNVVETAEQTSETGYNGNFYEPYGYESGYSDPAENDGYEQEAAIEAPAQGQLESTAVATPADDATSYEVYDYYHGAPERVVSEPQPSVEPTPSVPHYYGRYPYGYGYEYDYEYSKGYQSETQEPAVSEPAVSEPAASEPAVMEPALPQDAADQPWVDWSRELVGSVVESDLVDSVRAEAERVLAQVADVVETMNFDQVRNDTARAMATAVQQPQPAASDWNDANVFLFMFDSDLNADPVAVSELAATPWMADDQIADEQPRDAQDAASVEPVSDDSVSTVAPINRERVLQWARSVVDSAVVAWDRLTIELQRFAGRSMATVPTDDASTTQR